MNYRKKVRNFQIGDWLSNYGQIVVYTYYVIWQLKYFENF